MKKSTQLSSDRPSSSDSDLRGSRYQVLPPIGVHTESYEQWKKKSVFFIIPCSVPAIVAWIEFDIYIHTYNTHMYILLYTCTLYLYAV